MSSQPNLSRRLFLGGLATALAATVIDTREALPVLWGDGVHDDAPALNAWLRGEPIKVANRNGGLSRGFFGRDHIIRSAKLSLGSTLDIPADSKLRVERTKLTALPGFKGEHMVFVRGESRWLDCHLDGRNMAPVGMRFVAGSTTLVEHVRV